MRGWGDNSGSRTLAREGTNTRRKGAATGATKEGVVQVQESEQARDEYLAGGLEQVLPGEFVVVALVGANTRGCKH